MEAGGMSKFLEWGETYIRKSRIISITVEKKNIRYTEYDRREYSDVELKQYDLIESKFRRLEVLRDEKAKRLEKELCKAGEKIYGRSFVAYVPEYLCQDEEIKRYIAGISRSYPKVMTEYKRSISIILWWRKINAWHRRKIKPYQVRYRVVLAVDEPQEECNVSFYYGPWGTENEAREEAKKLAQDI
jgi:hypothetical protein